MKSALLAVCVIISTGAAVFFYLKGLHHQRSKPQIVNSDTVYVPFAIHDTLKVRVYRISSEKRSITEADANGKALYGSPHCRDTVLPGKAGHNFLALADTAYHDSLLSLRLGFLSPVPLHPDSRFIIDISFKRAQVIRYIDSHQTSMPQGKLHFSLNLGLGFGVIHGRTDIFAGAGISYSF